jgi:hypothetical protein
MSTEVCGGNIRSNQVYNEQLVPRIIRDASEERVSPILIATFFLVATINKAMLWFRNAQS